LYLTALHEIGHSLGLNHIMDEKSIMFPYYISRTDNFKLADTIIDGVIIREKYSKIPVTGIPTTEIPTTYNPVTEIPNPNNHNPIFPGFECLEFINWCSDHPSVLDFTNIYSLDGKLYLYKNDLFWILSKDDSGIMEISKQKYNHQIYFNEENLIPDLISVIRLRHALIMIYKNKIIVKHLSNCNYMKEYKLSDVNRNLDFGVINGVYYNITEDSLYLFSKLKPKSYTKISRFSSENTIYEEKPIQLWFLNTYDYDKVFEYDNKVFFMKNKKFDYYDWNLRTIVKDISFKNYFLRDECQLLPIIKN